MLKPFCIEFYCVLHNEGNWYGPTIIQGAVIPGAMEFLVNLFSQGYQPYIVSQKRNSWAGRRAMCSWCFDEMYEEVFDPDTLTMTDWRWKVVGQWTTLEPWDLHVYHKVKLFIKKLKFPSRKPDCLTIGTNVIRFEGAFPTKEEIDAFKPWRIHC